MTVTGRIDELEVLYHHTELLMAKLDIFESMTSGSSIIGTAFASSNGEKLRKAIDIASSTGKSSLQINLSSHISFINSTIRDMLPVIQLLKYMSQFCTLVEHELRNLTIKIKDFDLRWNQKLTIRICQIFVMYCKTIIFVCTHPIAKYIAIIVQYISTNSGSCSESASAVSQIFKNPGDTPVKILYFVVSAEDPFSFIRKRIEFMSNNMARLSGTIGTFFARLFGTYPLVDFHQFSIFNNKTQGGVDSESTLMSNEHIILSNLTLFKETLFFFLTTFFEKTRANQCFELIIESVLTETLNISITRMYSIPLVNLLSLIPHGFIPERIVRNAIDIAEQKMTTSHTQRIMYATFLLQDIVNVCKFRPSETPMILSHAFALSGFAFYELDQFFLNRRSMSSSSSQSNTSSSSQANTSSSSISPNLANSSNSNISSSGSTNLPNMQNSSNAANQASSSAASSSMSSSGSSSSARSKEAIELLSVVCELGSFILKYKEDLERFFLFNIAAVDLQFLKKQLGPTLFKEFESKEVNLPVLIQDLASSLEVIDLNQYDSGSAYDFTAFLLTHERILSVYNDLKMRERISYLDPIFEHLTTITHHIQIATSIVDTFLNHCPIHTLWRHTGVGLSPKDNIWMSIASDEGVPLDFIACLPQLFTFFANDTCLRQMFGVVTSMKKIYSVLRSKIFERLTRNIQKSTNPTSPRMKIGLQTRDFGVHETIFSTSEFATHKGITRALAQSQILTTRSVNEVKMFCQKIPQHVVVFDYIDNTAEYMTTSLLSSLGNILFPEKAPDPSALDRTFVAASEFLWPIYAQLGSSFPRQIYMMRLSNSKTEAWPVHLDEQVSHLDGTHPYKPYPFPKVNDPNANPQEIILWQRLQLTVKIEQMYDMFIRSSWDDFVFLTSLKGFWSKDFTYSGCINGGNSGKDGNNKDSNNKDSKNNDSSKNNDGNSKDGNGKDNNSKENSGKNEAYNNNMFYTLKSFKYIIKNLGIYSGVRIDRILTNSIATAIIDFHNMFIEKMRNSDIIAWSKDFFKNDSLPNDEMFKKANINLEDACRTFIKIGVLLKMREMLLIAMREIVKTAIPGFQELLRSSIERMNGQWNSPVQALVAESILGDADTNFVFIEEILCNSKVTKYPGSVKNFFFFLSLLLCCKRWDNVIYLADFDAMTDNLHLFPLAAWALMKEYPILFDSNKVTKNDITEGTMSLISAIATIVQTKRARSEHASRAFTILADKFPRIMGFEYGRLESIFPNRMVNFAYNAISDRQNVQTRSKKKTKK